MTKIFSIGCSGESFCDKSKVVRSVSKVWWFFRAAVLCGCFSALLAWAEASPFSSAKLQGQADTAAQTNSSSSPSPSTPGASSSDTTSSPKKNSASTTHKATAKKPAASSKAHYSNTKKRRPISPRVQRLRSAFTASTTLRPMAQQLLQDRSVAAYTGVQNYARLHSKEDAGALAWLVLGYAHILDKDYAKAIDPLSRAKLHAGDLGDYVAYYLGISYLQTGHTAEALANLSDFDHSHPDSLLVRDAQLSYADTLLIEGQAAEAVTLLEKIRVPIHSDVEFALGRAYAGSGQTAKAADTLSNIYYNLPTSAEADAAYAEYRKLPSVPLPTVAQLRTRALGLMNHKRYADAVDAFRSLAGEATPADRPAMQLSLADALHRAGRDRDAKQTLATVGPVTGELNAQRLYLYGQIAWDASDNATFYQLVDQLRQTAPASPWLEQALLSAANLHLVHHEYDQALDCFREAQQRFPDGPRASYVHWKAAWLTLRQGRNDEAKKAFEEQIALYPTGGETPAALYWRARLAEEDNQFVMARAFYQKLSDRYRNFYYAVLARDRMTHLPSGQAAPADAVIKYAILDRVPPLDNNGKVTETDPPADELHLQKAELLGNGGLVDFAVRELQAAAAKEGGSWAPAETAQLYTETGHYDRAIEYMKHSAPNYFALDIPDLPRKYWEALFPKPYWSDLKHSSTANGLDPYLVASLIRQESEFNPYAVSRANAVGLMQLLPKTGRAVAKEEKLKRYNASQLYTPAVNMQLGTRYFRGMVDHFGGSFEYALAAYNAGSDRVEEWLGQGKYRDPQEFVESIPFTETREYVQAIMRNAGVYRQLYGTP
jgi:soluble lytic murein transglycosylase